MVHRGHWRSLCRARSQRQQLAYVYFEDQPGWRSAAKLLSKDAARRIAVNIAKLPELRRREMKARIS
jgi:DNA-directed RNA polymerase specialized sigma24 family protein